MSPATSITLKALGAGSVYKFKYTRSAVIGNSYLGFSYPAWFNCKWSDIYNLTYFDKHNVVEDCNGRI